MTKKRLAEIKKAFDDGEAGNAELGEIMIELFTTSSAYFKELKEQISELKSNQEILYEEIHNMKVYLNPVYSIVYSDEED